MRETFETPGPVTVDGLTLATEKTRILPVHRHQPPGQGRFEFLGFEVYWGRDRAGTLRPPQA